MTTRYIDQIADYQAQAEEFLAKSRESLAQRDFHQAPEKGWGAVAPMDKAVAVAQGWAYDSHSDFSSVLYQARLLAGNSGLLGMRAIASELHANYYRRKRHLNAESIRKEIESITEMLAILQPLTGINRNGEAIQ